MRLIPNYINPSNSSNAEKKIFKKFSENKSLDNWVWLKDLVSELNSEYRYRYEKSANHKSFEITARLKKPRLPSLGLLEHPQTMPDEYKVSGNPVAAYRNFYIGSKSKFATWKKRGIPCWYKDRLGFK